MEGARLVVLTEQDFEAKLERAAEEGARRALLAVGVISVAPSKAQSIKDFARSHSVSVATVRRMIDKGLPVERIGRRAVRIRVETAETWLANRRTA